MKRRPTLRAWHPCIVGVLALAMLACASDKNTIVEATHGVQASPAAIDQDPWALLPSGPVAWGYVDAQQLFASRFGPALVRLVTRRLPGLTEAGFDPQRDLQALHLGAYSIQGADVLGVVTGQFNPEQIEAGLTQNPVTPLGVELVKTSYSGRTLYMAESSGFSIITTKTALFGNQMGMRRAIDRIDRGKLDRQLPTWLETQLTSRVAPIVVGMNLLDNPLSEATRRDLPFLNGMQTLGVLGNFQEPGLNLAGTASYDDERAAQAGAQNLELFDDYLKGWAPLMALLGIVQPLRSLTAESAGTEARFVAEVDGAAIDRLLSQLDGVLPGANAPSAPPPAVAPAPGTATE